MKKNCSGKRGLLDCGSQNLQPDKVGWIRKFCGRGIFREIWRNRFVLVRGDQLFICDKEVKEPSRADELFDLSDYERCEEIRKNKSRSKKSHSKFRLQRSSTPGNTAPNLIFLAVSPEEKESWINVLNVSIVRAKNRILDEVTVDDSQLCHLTRDRVKIPHGRRLPTRGHLLALASTPVLDGTVTLDLIQEEGAALMEASDGDALRVEPDKGVLGPDCPRSKTDGTLSARTTEASGKSQSLPREVAAVRKQTPQPGRPLTPAEKNHCVSMDEILPRSETTGSASIDRPINRLQDLIGWKLQETEKLLTDVRLEGKGEDPAEAERLLKEAANTWNQAHQVLEEVKELRDLYRELDSLSPASKRPNPDIRS